MTVSHLVTFDKIYRLLLNIELTAKHATFKLIGEIGKCILKASLAVQISLISKDTF